MSVKPPVPALSEIPTVYKDSIQAINFCLDETKRIITNTDTEFSIDEKNARLSQVHQIMSDSMTMIIRINNNGGKSLRDKIEEIELTPFPVTP